MSQNYWKFTVGFLKFLRCTEVLLQIKYKHYINIIGEHGEGRKIISKFRDRIGFH